MTTAPAMAVPTPAAVQPVASPPETSAAAPLPPSEGRTMADMEIEAISQAVAQCGGNISEASKRLGISRNTIYRKLRWK